MGNAAFNAEKGHALVIGVGQRAGDNEAMKTTSLDAIRIKQELQGRVLFQEPNVRLLTDTGATRAAILAQLDDLIAKTTDVPAEMVIIYFSGHGCVINNTYYIICNDTVNEDVAGSAIEGADFAAQLLAIKTDKMLILLDCCHSGGMYNAMVPPAVEYKAAEVPFAPDDMTAIASTTNRVIISASAAAEVSFATSPLSVFTYALVEGLAGMFFSPGSRDVDQDTNVTLMNLAMYLRERVVPLTEGKQHPQLNTVPKSATTDFLIARYAKGQPKEPLFDGVFKLRTDSGKEINTSMAPLPDPDYRKQFTWILGNNNTIIQNANTIINNFYASVDQNKPLNFYLTKVLISALCDNKNDDAIKFSKDNAEKWYLKSDKCRDAQLIITLKSYNNVVGIQLTKLISIGTEEFTAKVGIRYVNRCIDVAKATFQLLDFALLSDLWTKDKAREGRASSPSPDQADAGADLALLPDETAVLKAFFDYEGVSVRVLEDYINLFRTLIKIYTRLKLSFPIDELNTLAAKLGEHSDFYNTCDKLIDVQNQSDGDKSDYQNCLVAEKHLADLTEAMGFLSAYKMVSVKNVNYEEARNSKPNYLHDYVEIKSSNNANDVSKGLKYFPSPVNTDAILLYRGNYIGGINLSPFIIDYNALNLVSGIKICLLTSRYTNTVTDPDDSSVVTTTKVMRFVFSGDDIPQEISYAGILEQGKKLNDLLKDNQSRSQVKLDSAFLQFDDARASLVK